MSADEIRTEQRSSVRITENAKHEPQVEVKIYSHDVDSLNELREAAVTQFKLTQQDLSSALRRSDGKSWTEVWDAAERRAKP